MTIRFLTLAFLAFLVCTTSAQTTSQRSTINVTGTAEINVVPDSALFTMGVEKVRKEMIDAKRENDAAVSEILALAKKNGVADKDVKTDYISVSKRYEFIGVGRDRKRVFVGYAVSKTVIVKLKDLTKFEDFFSAVLTTGVTSVRGVYFQTSEFQKYKREMRIKAMRVAKQKATEMTAAIGQSLGKAIQINENQGGRFATPNITANYLGGEGGRTGVSAGSSQSGTFSPGTIKISSQVSVKFLIE